MPRAVSAAATARKDVAPVALISRMIGTTLAAKRSATAALASLPSLVATASLGPPSFLPLYAGGSSRRSFHCRQGIAAGRCRMVHSPVEEARSVRRSAGAEAPSPRLPLSYSGSEEA
jgi:hypothetical protein